MEDTGFDGADFGVVAGDVVEGAVAEGELPLAAGECFEEGVVAELFEGAEELFDAAGWCRCIECLGGLLEACLEEGVKEGASDGGVALGGFEEPVGDSGGALREQRFGAGGEGVAISWASGAFGPTADGDEAVAGEAGEVGADGGYGEVGDAGEGFGVGLAELFEAEEQEPAGGWEELELGGECLGHRMNRLEGRAKVGVGGGPNGPSGGGRPSRSMSAPAGPGWGNQAAKALRWWVKRWPRELWARLPKPAMNSASSAVEPASDWTSRAISETWAAISWTLAETCSLAAADCWAMAEASVTATRTLSAHGGMIHVASRPGRGTSFRVFLPLAD